MDLDPEIQDGFGPNPYPILLSYPNKGFFQIQIYTIQTDYKEQCRNIIIQIHGFGP